MTDLIIFAALMAALFSKGISGNDIIVARDGDQVDLRSAFEADTCVLKTNIGEEYIYDTTADTSTIRDDVQLIGWARCSIRVYSVKLEDAGNWTITSYFNDVFNSETFTVYIGQRVDVIPNSLIEVVAGNFIYVELDADLENLTSCEVIAPNDTRIDLLTVNRDDFRRYGECGFRAMLQSDGYGAWCLKATIDDKLMYTGCSEIIVYEKSNGHNQMINVTLKRGCRGQLGEDIGVKVDICQLTDPSRVTYPVTIGSCKHTIPVVTIRDEGIWIARYGVPGSLVLSYAYFNVTTYDTQTIGSNVTRMENGDIQLQCHSYNEDLDSFVSCRFITPNGQVLNLLPGIGSKHYRAFNVSTRREMPLKHSCGVIILSPSLDEDIGMWKCIIQSDKHLEAVSAIRVDPSLLGRYETQNLTIDAKSVYVKQSESFQVTCIADAPLHYCWFRSPNGTMYSVSQKQPQTPSNLPYRGSGLDSGECGAEIDHAEITDQGQWTCNLGIVNGDEKHASISVNVVDSYVIPGVPKLFLYEGDSVNLSCSILPSVTDRAVHYCRWVRPDGYGIHNDEHHRYRTSHTNTRCDLMISECRRREDMGEWTCVAGLQGAIDEEAWTTIRLSVRT